jgi:hypothetical protein
MKFEQPKGEKEQLISEIKGNAMFVENLFLAGTKESLADIHMRPMTWNENQGVIMFADENGAKWAVPSTGGLRDRFFQAGMEQDESVGVPALNNLDVIGGADSQARNEWQALYGQAKTLETAQEARKAEAGSDQSGA